MAPITRSIARSTNAQLLCLDASVKKTERRFICIICLESFRSKAGVSLHFQRHRTRPANLPAMAHRSCWPDVVHADPNREAFQKIAIGDDTFYALSATGQEDVLMKMDMANEGMTRKKDYEAKMLWKKLREWNWWYDVNKDALKARMELGPEGLFPLQGEDTLNEPGLNAAARDNALLEITPPSSSPPANSNLDYFPHDPLAPAPSRSYDSYNILGLTHLADLDRDAQNHIIPHTRLCSARPLTATPIIECLSTTIINHIGVGSPEESTEDREQIVRIAQAASKFIGRVSPLGTDDRGVRKLQKHFKKTNGHHDYQSQAARYRLAAFRRDRELVWKHLEEVIAAIFYPFAGRLAVAENIELSDDVIRVMKASKSFAKRLNDTKTAEEIRRYLAREI